MRRSLFRIAMSELLTLIALIAILASSAWAQPIFKILHGVPGGLFTGLTFDANGESA